MLEPFGLCKHSDHKCSCLLSGKRHRAPCTKGWSRELDDEAPPFPTDLGWGMLENQPNLMNKGIHRIKSQPYEIMSSLVCPHSRGKSSFLLYFFPCFPISILLLASFYLSSGMLFSHMGGFFAEGRILVSCFSLVLASKPYSFCKQEARCV